MSAGWLQHAYSFVHAEQPGAAPLRRPEVDSDLLESIRQRAEQRRNVASDFFSQNGQRVLDAARGLAAVFACGGRLFSMGNGGSSYDAAHFSFQFLHPETSGTPSLPAFNLVMDAAMLSAAMLSAVGNDVGVRHVFRRQVEAHARSGDGLIGFSTTGNCDSLLGAFEQAKQLGLVTLGLAGGDGGSMKTSGLVDHLLVVSADSVHRVREVHVATYHLLSDLTHTLLAERRGLVRRSASVRPM